MTNGDTTAPTPKVEWRTVKAILAASSGNLVEWFDFYIYAFFSVYFADQFFSGTGETGALMKSAGVFFVGFLMRPIGGYIFGRIADRYGRKQSMLIAIIMMCAMTTILFLGGWTSPIDLPPFTWVPGVVWFLAKVVLVFFLFAMAKAMVPRYRYDQLMRLGWKVFLPLSLFWVFLVSGVLMLYRVGI